MLATPAIYKVNALVVGGDLAGKAVMPVVKTGTRYRLGLREDGPIIPEAEIEAHQRQAAAMGRYGIVVEASDATRLAEGDDETLTRLWSAASADRIRSWMALANERLQGTNVRCYICGGNDDPPEVVQSVSDNAGANVVFCDERVVPLAEGLELVSVGHANPTPWHTPREVSEETLQALIERVASSASNPRRSIFNLHVPPYGSCLDVCPQLDTTTDPPTPIMFGGSVVLHHAGSTAVRQALEEYQPIVSLHGHIHESRCAERIGATLALNPGSEYSDGILRGAIVTIDGARVTYQFTSG